jgi:hypothetical protein
MEVYCDDFDVWDFIPAFLFAIAQTEIDSSVTSILNFDAAKHWFWVH